MADSSEPLISIREAARHPDVAISHVTLARQVKLGQVRSHMDGRRRKVRLSEVIADRRQTDSSYRPLTGPTSRGGNGEAAPESIVDAKRRKEIALAGMRELELREKQGELVDAATVHDAVFTRFRQERDALLTWPARISAVMAADLGVDAGRLLVTLEKHVREFLAERSVRFEIPKPR